VNPSEWFCAEAFAGIGFLVENSGGNSGKFTTISAVNSGMPPHQSS
jgi:hypothetical protein